MEIKEINEVLEQAIADLANKDEMEAEDGMNIVEDIDAENELADMKSQKRVYDKAYEALNELHLALDSGYTPSGAIADSDLISFNEKIKDLLEEIYSRGLAFES